MRLITISISHFVEKVKWALKLAGIAYEEESHIPGVHAAVTLWHTRGKHRATPVLIDGDRVVADSTEILQYLAAHHGQAWLYAPRDALALEEQFDKNIGPHTRRFMYQQLFANDLSVAELFAQDVIPEWQRAILPFAAPVIKEGMIMDMAIHPRAAEASRKTFEEQFAFVAQRLSDGRKYLCGDKLSAADITFAALSAPAILPAGYGARLPRLEDAPAGSAVPGIVESYRATPAGEFVLRLYSEHRN